MQELHEVLRFTLIKLCADCAQRVGEVPGILFRDIGPDEAKEWMITCDLCGPETKSDGHLYAPSMSVEGQREYVITRGQTEEETRNPHSPKLCSSCLAAFLRELDALGIQKDSPLTCGCLTDGPKPCQSCGRKEILISTQPAATDDNGHQLEIFKQAVRRIIPPPSSLEIEGHPLDQYDLAALKAANDAIESGAAGLDQETRISRWERVTGNNGGPQCWCGYPQAYRLFTEDSGQEEAILLITIFVGQGKLTGVWWARTDWESHKSGMSTSAFRLLWDAGWIALPPSKLIELLGPAEARRLAIIKGERRPRAPQVPITTSTIQGGLGREARQALAHAAKVVSKEYCGPPSTCEVTGWDRIAEEGQIWAFRFYFRGRRGPVPYLIVTGGEGGKWWLRTVDHYTDLDTPIPQPLWDLIEGVGWVELTVHQLRQMGSEGFATHHGTLVTDRSREGDWIRELLLEIYEIPDGELVTVEHARDRKYDCWNSVGAPQDWGNPVGTEEDWGYISTASRLIRHIDGTGFVLEDPPTEGGPYNVMTGGRWTERLLFRISPEGGGIPLGNIADIKRALPDGWFTAA